VVARWRIRDGVLKIANHVVVRAEVRRCLGHNKDAAIGVRVLVVIPVGHQLELVLAEQVFEFAFRVHSSTRSLGENFAANKKAR